MYLLFEVGGTKTRIGFSADGQNLLNTEIIPSLSNFDDFLNELKERVKNTGQIKAIGGGMPVVFDKDRNKIIQCAHLPEWVGKNAKQELEELFQVPVFLDNEVSMAALAEAIKGAGAGYPIVAYLTIGTGVGSSRVVDGRSDKKAFGFEAGHQIIMPDGDLCSCGGRGHLEAYVGGSYFEAKYHQKGEDIKNPEIWDEIARYLSIGLYNLSVHWSPDLIILGGAVSQSIPLEKVRAYLKQFSTIFPTPPEITRAKLGDQAGLLGALSLLQSLL